MSIRSVSRKQEIEELLENVHMVGRQLRPLGADPLTYSQAIVMRVVERNPGIGIKQMASLLHTSSSAVTQLVDGLARKGYLIREGSEDDRRALRLRLSEPSLKRLARSRKTLVNRLSAIFDVLSDEEFEQYCSLNRKLASGKPRDDDGVDSR